ncbi:multiple epidermal growth factor-like domains 11 [Elysia marginata]|uniref:Multiple epidermal growth factor-like domains 11 n=1 Tax=Elysia marginata TaxID=1093978 RepID=A0AAV4GMP9_9GAST|nr:multiple epidermal growth factor-like domains 11 [Elysia marginata]
MTLFRLISSFCAAVLMLNVIQGTVQSITADCETQGMDNANFSDGSVHLDCDTGCFLHIGFVSEYQECPELHSSIITDDLKPSCELQSECFYNASSSQCENSSISVIYSCRLPCRQGRWNFPECDYDCGKNCKDRTCDQQDGMCYECSQGQITPWCTEEGKSKLWGVLRCYECSQGQITPWCTEGKNKLRDVLRCYECSQGQITPWCTEDCEKGTFGENCTNKCSENCQDSDKVCHHVTGVCLKGCQAGYSGEFCDTTCSNDTYGENCENSCSVYCARAGESSTCSPVNGSCFYGCRRGYTGDTCTTPGTFEVPFEHHLVLVLIILVVVILVLLVVIAIYVKIKREPSPAISEHVISVEKRKSKEAGAIARESFFNGSSVDFRPAPQSLAAQESKLVSNQFNQSFVEKMILHHPVSKEVDDYVRRVFDTGTAVDLPPVPHFPTVAEVSPKAHQTHHLNKYLKTLHRTSSAKKSLNSNST